MKGEKDEKCLGTKELPTGVDELYRTRCKLLFTIKTLFALHMFHDPELCSFSTECRSHQY